MVSSRNQKEITVRDISITDANVKLTLCLSTLICLRFGSNNNCLGSMLIGDCRFPLLHMLHSVFKIPQKSGPGMRYMWVSSWAAWIKGNITITSVGLHTVSQ